MLDNGLTHLSRAQAVAFLPLHLDPCRATIQFNCLLISGLKGSFPTKAKTISIVANVHPLLFSKALLKLFIQSLKHFSRAYYRRFTSRERGSLTKEIETQRKRQRVGMFVVRKDRLVGRIIGRRINVFCYGTARGRAFAIFEQRTGNAAADLFELGRCLHVETTKEQGAVP